MVFEAKMMDIRREARLEGRTEADELMKQLVLAGKTEEIMRACDDQVYKEKLMREYGIITEESI